MQKRRLQQSGQICWKGTWSPNFRTGTKPWLQNLLVRSKRKGAEYSQNGGFFVMWTKIWPQRRFGRSKKKMCEKQFCHWTQLCLSVLEHEDMGHNGLLTKPKKPLVRMNARSETMARRWGRKPLPGRKQRLPQQEMEVLESSYDRDENHRGPATTTACWSGAFAGYVHRRSHGPSRRASSKQHEKNSWACRKLCW